MSESVFTPFIAIYTKQVLNGERTIESVPEVVREQVREQLSEENREALINVYATNILSGKLFPSEISNSEIFDEVQAVVDSITQTNINLYVADIIEGKKSINDVPYTLRNQVLEELESNIGKKP